MLTDQKLLNLEQTNVATFLAELRDIRNLTDLVRFQRNHTDVSDKFLGVNFGVLPLVSDIQKIYKNVKGLKPSIAAWNEMSDSNTVRSYHKTITDDVQKGRYDRVRHINGSLLDIQYRYEFFWEQHYVEKAHVYVRPKSCNAGSLGIRSKVLGLHKPLATAWELVPFSFAIDWVTNIGDLIDQFEYSRPSLGFEIVGCGVSGKLVTTCRVDTYTTIEGCPEVYTGSSDVRDVEYYRSPYPMSSLQTQLANGLKVSPFEVDFDLSGMQIALSAALADQKFFKGYK
jgi:hypothetical protein